MKFKVSQDCDYVMGHLRYGHLECEVEANSEEMALEMVENGEYDMELVIDDYSVDNYNVGNNRKEVVKIK